MIRLFRLTTGEDLITPDADTTTDDFRKQTTVRTYTNATEQTNL